VTLIGNDRVVENAPPPRSQRARLTPARRLALQLWLTSMLCWWVIGITFSHLWWLVNATQLRWILFCYAWEVPAVGWTGAVLLPYLGFRRVQRRLDAGDPAVGRDLVMRRRPLQRAAADEIARPRQADQHDGVDRRDDHDGQHHRRPVAACHEHPPRVAARHRNEA